MVRITIKHTQKASVKSNSAFTDLTLKYNKKQTKQNDRFSFKKMLTLKRFCEWSNEMLHIPTALRSFLFFLQTLIDPKTESSHPKYRKTSPAKAFFLLHLAAMTVGGPVENTNTHTLYLYYTSMHGTSM